MFMEVVSLPNPDQIFDAKIMIERDTYHSNRFHNDYNANQLIKRGDWKYLCNNKQYKITEWMTLTVEYYQMEEDIAAALCLWYMAHVKGESSER